MKLKKHYISLSLCSALMAGFTACNNSEVDEPAVIPGDESGSTFEEPDPANPVMVFNFSLEGEETTATRADGYDGAQTGQIGRGSKIDHLIFAVYKASNDSLMFTTNGADTVAKQLSNGKYITPSNGQFVIEWPAVRQIQLTAMEEGEYKIVCWAQSSQCKAYDTKDFTNVKVSYEGAKNNDETRDAFCVAQTFTVSENSKSTTVVLKRPFAQINVGTSGADYRNTAITPGGTYYTYSAVTISGAANSINIVKNEIGAAKTTATFANAKIPAYTNMQVPSKADDLLKSDSEIFLQIHLNNPYSTAPFAEYMTSYPTIVYDDKGNITEYLTETFKYLSMCYVLVPGGKSPLDNFRVTFSNDEVGTGFATYLEINNVPTTRNWRTNIIGGLYAPKKDKPNTDPDPTPGPGDDDDPDTTTPGPGDDDDPIDDPSSLFNDIAAKVLIISDYSNPDNNYQRDENEDNGFSEIK